MTPAAKLKVLTAASFIVLAGMAMPALAEGKGGVGGAVGGAVSGAVGAVGNAVGGVTGAVGDTVGGVTGAVGDTVDGVTGAVGGVTGTSTSPTGILTGTPKTLSPKALAKLRLQLLKAKAGIYVLDRRGNLVRVNVKVASSLLKVRANVYVLDSKGNLARVNAKIGVAGLLKAKAKVYVIDQNGNLLRATARANVGGPNGLNAKVGAKAGTGGVDVNAAVTIGGQTNGGPGGPGGPGQPGTSKSIADKIAAMSAQERMQLKKKCPAVLASPGSYSKDAVMVCRVLAQLAGI